MKSILIISVLVLGGLYILLKKRKKKAFRKVYHFGLQSALKAGKALEAKRYAELEKIIQDAELNERTQIIDHLALSCNEMDILGWRDQSNSDEAKLVLAAYYLHLAWIVRSHAFAAEVSDDNAERFFDHLNQSQNTFEQISENTIYKAEVFSRRIRLAMSMDDSEMAKDHFMSVHKIEPTMLWPYIHYAEMIQPKWGSNTEDVEAFYASLPNDFLIHSITELKLIADSMNMGENYFSKQSDDLTDFANQKLTETDIALKAQDVSSIHRYILFGYMERLSDTLGQKDLRAKYLKCIDGNFSMYPYGITI